MRGVLAVASSEGVLRQRLGQDITLHPVGYGEEHWLGQCKVSFHSAGHVLGSAQIRLESEGEVGWSVVITNGMTTPAANPLKRCAAMC